MGKLPTEANYGIFGSKCLGILEAN
uniref:Uncharacterized protein n=1 Tax=Arundo donax TaxID=35708 RepID=A0A0A9GI04_ARUDO